MNWLRRLARKLRNKLVHGGPEGQRTCSHGSDPRWCFDCRDRQGWQDKVFGHTTAETLPGELAWVEKLNDAYHGDTCEEAGS